MKVILVARKALAAYLISSAVRRPVDEDRRAVEIERPVKLVHHLRRARIVGADDDPVGMLEILDRSAFAQELGVGNHRHVGVRPLLADDALDLVAGADRDRGLGDHDGEAVESRGDLVGGGINV